MIEAHIERVFVIGRECVIASWASPVGPLQAYAEWWLFDLPANVEYMKTKMHPEIVDQMAAFVSAYKKG